jgi:hypothetical protein
MMAPLLGVILWYGARGCDVICPLLRSRAMVFLGNISYAMYLFQVCRSHPPLHHRQAHMIMMMMSMMMMMMMMMMMIV